MKFFPHLLAFLLLAMVGCNSDDADPDQAMYFPPLTGSEWETSSVSSLSWNESQVPALIDFLEEKNTKAFLILVKGEIVMEEYFGGHKATDTWQWNSAGKTLVAATTGIAQQEGLLDINTQVSRYFGTGWTNMPIEKENLITSKHLLSMTSGINDENQFVIRPNLTYLADAGTRWSYHNVFQRLMDVISAASGRKFDTYFDSKLRDKIGMDGTWNFGLVFNIYHSTARSMARFGLLALNEGKWVDAQIVSEEFFKESIRSSQDLNPAYGYFWWLNGKSKFMLPGSQTVFPGSLIPNAPADMYAAMGAEDQRIYVVPSKKLVIIRMGRASDPSNPSFAYSGFDQELWQKINAVID
ncbi:serine hydrolase domain-containing protein [Algoriphagus sp.]|uniref:serine hydrolase domain-containing protein n=1 Tax=Algoriphagus sp. TaxID=1872435 RepID=UPI003919D307